MVEYTLAISKKSKLVVLWRLESKLIASGYEAPQYQNAPMLQINRLSKDYTPSRLPQNVEYLAFSAASSITTSNRFPLLLRPCTKPRSNSTTVGKSPRISMAATLIFFGDTWACDFLDTSHFAARPPRLQSSCGFCRSLPPASATLDAKSSFASCALQPPEDA